MTAGLDLPRLFLDLYQLTMSQSYWRTDPNKEATFELSFRSLPKDRNYLVIHGIERALKIVSNLSFDDESIQSLRELRKFDESFLNPNTQECMEKVKEISQSFWELYTAEDPEHSDIHMLPYPINVDEEGTVTPLESPFDCFPDTVASVLGNPCSLLPEKLTT